MREATRGPALEHSGLVASYSDRRPARPCPPLKWPDFRRRGERRGRLLRDEASAGMLGEPGQCWLPEKTANVPIAERGAHAARRGDQLVEHLIANFADRWHLERPWAGEIGLFCNDDRW